MNGNNDENNALIIRISRLFIVLTFTASCLVAFAVGHISRILLIDNPHNALMKTYHDELRSMGGGQFESSKNDNSFTLPDPVLQSGKTPPVTTYTSKNFNTALSSTTHSRWMVTQVGEQLDNGLLETESSDNQCRSSTNDSCDNVGEVDEEEHLPAGQHLLIDIEHVDSVFLNSEERLATAMLDLVNECGLTLLSYHCHGLHPSGVSCAGVLLESHVSFHTWPEQGVITLDLFTCGSDSLLPIVPLAEKLFAVASQTKDSRHDVAERIEPRTVWAHKFRGFGRDNGNAQEVTDMFNFPVGQMNEFKKEIVSIETDFQTMHVYDVLRPSRRDTELYEKSLSNDGSYEALHPEFFEPDRIVFLDGILQSCKFGDAAYHEALVHPAMFAHENPKRVAIVGGGEGATLREVLKHNTVEKVIMIDIDEQMVEMSKKVLPFWSDCSMLKESTKSCFDDPRVETYYLDAFKWFIDRFSDESSHEFDEFPFDVIIMDALDPQIQKTFVDTLYDGGPFLRSLPNALGENGIIIAQVGEGNTISSPSGEHSVDRNRIKFIETLVSLGFPTVRDYEETHSFFGNPWEFVAAFKDYDYKVDWYAESAMIDLKIRQRGMITTSGGSPFLHFDGATMKSYRYPSKSSEVSFCRFKSSATDCVNGHGFDLERDEVMLSSLEMKPSSLGEKAGLGVFAKNDIPRNSYIGLGELTSSIYISPHSFQFINKVSKSPWAYFSKDIETYTNVHGHFFSSQGKTEVFIDSTIQCMINHGCVGTNNIGYNMTVTETSADPLSIPEEVSSSYKGMQFIYNPAKERQVRFYSSSTPHRDIKAGEELLDNYLGMTGEVMICRCADI
uniref:PABS domain-containing protein n=1 Tax=Pseudo-nitzschia australis TaxID=44445 RepID=A0A7S4EJQ9_9STRA